MKALFNSLPAPVWARNSDGQLIFVNAAYARAVDAEDASDAVERELELLDRAARAKLNDGRADGGLYCERLPAIAAGQRRIFDVVDAPSSAGSAGMAIDATEVEAMRAELARMASTSVASIAMPALPALLGASTTSKMRRWPAAMAGSRSQ